MVSFRRQTCQKGKSCLLRPVFFYISSARDDWRGGRNTLVAGEGFNESPTAVQEQLIAFLQHSPDRLFYIIDRGPPKASEWVTETVLSQGYRLQHREEHNQAMLMTFER